MIARIAIMILTSCALCEAYASKATITFAAATGSTQTNITLAFTGNDAKLRTVANGGAIQNTVLRTGVTVPVDFILTSDTTCATFTGGYAWVFDSYNPVTGELTGRALVTSLTAAATVVPTVCVGDAAVVTYQGGAVGAAFDGATTKAMWPLPDGTTISALDFSANGANGTVVAAAPATTGKIDGAISLNGSTQYVAGSMAATTPLPVTLRAWVKQTATFTYGVALSVDANNNSGYRMGTHGPTNKPMFTLGGVADYPAFSLATLTTGTWYYMAAVASGSSVTVYLAPSGGAMTSETIAIGAATGAMDKFHIGIWGLLTAVTAWPGPIDEAIVVGVARSANWIDTEFRNQDNPPAISAFTDLDTGVAQVVIF